MTERSAISGQRSASRLRLRASSAARARGPSRHARRGMALIDVIVGGVLLASGLAVVISLATRALRSQTDGEHRLVASWLADEYLNMVLVEGPVDYPKLYDNSGQCDYPFDEYGYDLNIEDQGLGVPFRVTATIRWEGFSGPRQVQVQTLISDRGGDPDQPRAPKEIVDRATRWYERYEQQQK